MDEATPDSRCAQALKKSARLAKQILDKSISPEEGARVIASEVGDCYEFLNSEIAAVDVLGYMSACADFYQEMQLEPSAIGEIDDAVRNAALELVRLMPD